MKNLKRLFDGGWIMKTSFPTHHVEHGCTGLVKKFEGDWEWSHCLIDTHDPDQQHIPCAYCVQKRSQVDHNDRCCS